CDNGGEFRNKELNDFCSQKGIKREFSNARTPQHNGVAERRNRSLIEAARTMVLVNKAHNKTPYQLFNGRTPAIGFLKPFGCHVMILNTLDNLGKFEAKGDEGYFLGYSMSSKAFKVFNKRTKRVEENVHIEFLENKVIEKGSGPNWLFDIDSLTKSINYVPVVDADPRNTDAPESSGNSNPTATSTNPPADQLGTLTVETLTPTVSSPVPTACFSDSQEPSTSPTPTLKIHRDHPKSQIIGPVETLIQTRNKSKEVWSLVDYPKGVRPIGTKWVLKNKKDERGIVIRNKARLVAQGHTQEEGIDYDEVFAPVARIEVIRLFLAYASFMGFTVYQMDVNSAFLYGTIDEEVSMIGSLMYLTASRPDIMFAVCACARHQVIPKECHLHATIVATSTTEAEYVAAAIKNPVYHSKTKHIEIRHHFIRDFFEKKLINVDHIHTDEDVADLLTKPFDARRFQYLVSEHNADFHPIVDFIEASPLRYALTFKPTIYVSYIRQFWSTARIEARAEGTQILATVDGVLRIVTESSLRRNLKLQEEEGISSLPDTELFENLTLMGYNISPNQKFTF
nr:hypothetical protein [Tanacetum cinerariifolium]